MSAIVLTPCGDTLIPELAVKTLETDAFEIVISQTAQNAFTQINEQLRVHPIRCPVCNRYVERIDPNLNGPKRFPLSEGIFSRIKFSPLNVELKGLEGTANKVHNLIFFTRVEEGNIINRGQNSRDNGKTYQRLAELANDFNGLVSSFGESSGELSIGCLLPGKPHLISKGYRKIVPKV